MPNSYIGVNGIARKITGGYIGINNVARKITKAYIGDENGVAKLIYDAGGTPTPSGTPFNFNDSIAPTTWTVLTSGIKYKATNTYGTWNIEASRYSSSYYASRAFDGTSSSQWRISDLAADEEVYIKMEFPIPINPTIIQVRSVRSTNAKLQLQKYADDTWIDVQSLTKGSGVGWDEVHTSYNEYFKGMRVIGTRFSSDYPILAIYEFYIQQGTGLQ